jgi:hypothetical protein
MPKTAMNEDDLLPTAENKIGVSRKSFDMKPVSIPKRKN